MSLRAQMTATASTSRPSKTVAGKSGDLVAKLSSVLLTPPMTLDFGSSQNLATRQAIGLQDSMVQIWLAYCEPHNHLDGVTPVTNALPEIKNNDRVIIGSTTYIVRHAQSEPAGLSLSATLELILIVDASK